MEQVTELTAEGEAAPPDVTPEEFAALMLSIMSDGLDHPELWEAIPEIIASLPGLPDYLHHLLSVEDVAERRRDLLILLAICGAALGQAALMRETLAPLAADHSQSPLVQGALFHLDKLIDPDNPKFDLEGSFCPVPFQEIDVLERSAHLCCASYLQASVGDMSSADWQSVWNGEVAEAIRESIHDGSYRYCNKIACPEIQARRIRTKQEVASDSSVWRDIVEQRLTRIEGGPKVVNLAYDRTCNLSCPSCRTERFAADQAQRAAYEQLQERAILPMLKGAGIVFITGSGDPFASKNFRRLMEQLTPGDYPDLKFQIMTNGMLFTPAQWENFPALHGRVDTLKISVDAASGFTHEALRRGARWPVMLENMRFAGDLTAAGQIDRFTLVFVVQDANFREMGDAVDLAERVGATGILFARLTNWGTFSTGEYRDKAVFLPGHPQHLEFLEAMQDSRLRQPAVTLGDLQPFVSIASS